MSLLSLYVVIQPFAERIQSAKSSISNINDKSAVGEEMEIGNIETITGAGGGVVFTPSISDRKSRVNQESASNCLKVDVSLQVAAGCI